MKKHVLTLLPAALLAGCATVGSLEPITIPASEFRPIERADRVFATERWVIDYYLRLDGRGSEEVTSQLGRDGTGNADRVLLFSTDNYADDSVQGEQWRVALDSSDIGYLVIQAGKRYKCYRGPNAGNWQRDLCP
ncbi:hypothetical protein GCM10009127_01900 [Alteraurantiacibacter aestuarii]|uniref:Lipoprotein n=1 Tax=Alteraurantiacibacter aestuarii TaxID=650004 RepID=A0A844ZNB2_9SPHN|nr:hypothetical protein [Alteraurantiacibacter aestuarii]MXO88556.1 hypothetical protein [Alteraurantiacibacter aestuarii]